MTLRPVPAALVPAFTETLVDVERLQHRAPAAPTAAVRVVGRQARAVRERKFARKVAEIARGLT